MTPAQVATSPGKPWPLASESPFLVKVQRGGDVCSSSWCSVRIPGGSDWPSLGTRPFLSPSRWPLGSPS